MKRQPSGYLAAADVLRAAAIGLVGWYHIWQQSWLDPGVSVGSIHVNLQQVVRNGFMMVDVLLVLSGFLLALPYARARLGHIKKLPRTGDFYRRRFWRIMPSYLLAVLGTFFLWALPQKLYATPWEAIRDLLAHLTFTHTLRMETYFGTPIPGVLWTLGIEVPFYVLFPLLARGYVKRPGAVCYGLIALGLGARSIVRGMDDTLMWVNQLPCMLDLYGYGMLAALIFAKLEKRAPLPAARRLCLAGAVLAFCVMLQLMYRQSLGDGEAVRQSQMALRLPMGLAAATFLVCGCLAPAGASRVFGNPVTKALSAASYPFYIWHQFLAVRLKEWHIPAYLSELPNVAGAQPWQTRYTLLCFALAAGLALALTYGFERPVYRRATRGIKA